MKAARKFNKNLTTDDMVTVNVLGSDYFYPSDDAQNFIVISECNITCNFAAFVFDEKH